MTPEFYSNGDSFYAVKSDKVFKYTDYAGWSPMDSLTVVMLSKFFPDLEPVGDGDLPEAFPKDLGFTPVEESLGFSQILKANPYHDERGRFSSKDAARFVSIGGVFDRQRANAKQRAQGEDKPLHNVSKERLDSLDARLVIAGSWGRARGAVMDSMSDDEAVAYIDRGLTTGVLAEPDFYVDGKRNPEYEAFEKAIDAVIEKFKDPRGYRDEEFLLKATDEDLKPVLKYLKRGLSGLALVDLARRASEEGKRKLMDKHLDGVDRLMPDKGKVTFGEMGASYTYDKANVGKDTLSKARMLDLLTDGVSGDTLDGWADRIKPTTAMAIGVGMFHKDRDAHMASFWSSWSRSGGSTAQSHALDALKDFHPGNKDLWTTGQNKPPPSQNLRKHLEQTYKETQDFYDKKYNEGRRTRVDAGEKELTLHRGVAVKVGASTYVPGAIESWSTQRSTATKFADMMSDRRNGTVGTVLTTKVKVKDLFATYESLAGWFPAEKNLKGKKEHIVLGGSLKDIDGGGP